MLRTRTYCAWLGSILGPVWVTPIMNDFIEYLIVLCSIYAGDLKLFTTISSPKACLVLQHILKRVSECSVINHSTNEIISITAKF